MEQVLVVRKDIQTLDSNLHNLDETKMTLDARRNARTELELRQEVGFLSFRLPQTS